MKVVRKIACAVLLAGLLGSGAGAAQVPGAKPEAARLRMKRVDVAQMPRADRDLFAAGRGRLARAARLFGYQMQEPGWTCEAVMARDIPDYLMVACRKGGAGAGRADAFTGLIARSGGAVYVVPVLFGGATPWKSAANMKASREIFNHVVPEHIAAESVKPGSDWMELAMTFTALSGDDSVVLTEPSRQLKWLTAPAPTIQMRNGSSLRTIMFSDVSRRDGVRVWTLTFDRQGRLLRARVAITPDLKAERVSTKMPHWEELRTPAVPNQGARAIPAVQH